jgi:hypothetical protein
MLQVIQTKSISLLDTLVLKLEQYEDVAKRPRVFAPACAHGAESKEVKKKDSANAPAENGQEKLKHLSLELIDIGLHTGLKGLELIQATTPYKLSD